MERWCRLTFPSDVNMQQYREVADLRHPTNKTEVNLGSRQIKYFGDVDPVALNLARDFGATMERG